MGVTQKEIAARVGVSQQLVAFALNGKGRMSDEIRQRIEEEALRAGYRPNRAARALLTQKTNLIAVWVPHIETDLCARVLSTCERVIRHSGYEMIVVSGVGFGGPELDGEAKTASNHKMKWPTDGILMFDPPASVRAMVTNKWMPPTVLMGPYALVNNIQEVDSVGVDLDGAARGAMQHLLDKGCRRVLHITIPALLEQQETRSAVYFEMMQAAGLKPEVLPVEPSASHRTTTQIAFQRYVEQHGWPDALFCSNDDASLGATRVIRAAGKSIPQDIKIIGCDGIEDAQDAFTALSTIVQPIEAVCRRAWELLEMRLEQPEKTKSGEVFTAHLVLRDSSA